MQLPVVHFSSTLPTPDGRDWGRPLGPALLLLRCEASGAASLADSTGLLRRWDDPLDALRWMSQNFAGKAAARWAGYLSYDLGPRFEPAAPRHASDLPLFVFSLHDAPGDPSPAVEFQHRLSDRLLTSSLPRTAYLERARRAIQYVQAGDVFQVNLAQQFVAGLTRPPAVIWKNLCRDFPAAYGAFLDYADHAVISNSPELFLRVTADRTVVTRPIKGTRPREAGMDSRLLVSEKDRAELNMIVDLQRNDLGRVCRVGTVRVTQPRTIETHPTVYHGVATVEGKLNPGTSFVDLLAATFPGGSITGAPKIRAMQVIAELEPVPRGVYCGAVGYLAADGSLQFNVAIRTMTARGGRLTVPVGGGIVADSDPADEYAETLVKSRAMFAAAGISVPGTGPLTRGSVV